ncbi:MAG: DUF6089 family protein [Bacteroidota bacterium]
MKKLINLTLIYFFAVSIVAAQHVEIGVGGGFSAYNGDLSPTDKAYSYGDARYTLMGFIRYHHNDYITIKGSLTGGRLSADDRKSKLAHKRERNLHFKSVFGEAAITAEWNILGYEPRFLTKVFTPYVFVGIGMVGFNPQANINGQWVDLQSRRTEGQGLPQFPDRQPYKKFAFSFPVGAGIKYAISDRINIGGEVGLRRTTTDYIDDVSTTYVADEILEQYVGPHAPVAANRTGGPVETGQSRGNPNVNDYFIVGVVTVSYNIIDSGLSGGRKKRRRSIGCPTF